MEKVSKKSVKTILIVLGVVVYVAFVVYSFRIAYQHYAMSLAVFSCLFLYVLIIFMYLSRVGFANFTIFFGLSLTLMLTLFLLISGICKMHRNNINAEKYFAQDMAKYESIISAKENGQDVTFDEIKEYNERITIYKNKDRWFGFKIYPGAENLPVINVIVDIEEKKLP